MTQGIETETITIAELTCEDLGSGSGVFHEDAELTNMEAARDLCEALGWRVWLASNSVLSPEAKQHNSDLNRDPSLTTTQRQALFMVAIRAERPI